MTKDKLVMELENYKRLYKNAKEELEKVKLDINEFENLKELNLQLQVDNEWNKRMIRDLKHEVYTKDDKIETYEKVFDILKMKVGD